MKITVWAVVQNIGGELFTDTFQTEHEATTAAWGKVEALFMESDGEEESFEDFKKENDGDLNTAWIAATGGDNQTLHVEPIEIEVPTHKVTVYSLSTDTNHGTTTNVFATEAERNERAWAFIADWTRGDETPESLKAKYHDPSDAWEGICEGLGSIDHMGLDSHEIEIPAPARTTQPKAVETLRGALSYCVQQIEQMKGMFDDDDDQIKEALEYADEALTETKDVAAPAPIGIRLEGGMIQSIFSYAPESCPVVYVIDHDTDGIEEDALSVIPHSDERAIITRYKKPEYGAGPEWFAELAKGFDATEGQANG